MASRTSWRGVALSVLAVGAVILAAHAAGIVLCPFRRLTGWPCPGCGSTRAVLALVKGDFAAALALNPLAVTLIPLAPLVWLFGRRRQWSPWVLGVGLALATVATALNWAYLLRLADVL